MEKTNTQPNESFQVAKMESSVIYGGASKLLLSESERTKLAAPFDDLDYEIRPDGFIYMPQALTLKRLNDVIGIGQWGLLMINNGMDDIGNGQFKVFYDGCLIIRDCFVSRSVGEAQYSTNNKNQSRATALESSKSDCRQRCLKDLGVASEAWQPQFMRRWQKDHAIRVYVDNKGSKEVVWRRKDIDAFWNEIGPVPTKPTVPDKSQVNGNGADTAAKKTEYPWLNHGPDYDAALRDLQAGFTTIQTLKATKYRISKETEAALMIVLTKEWTGQTDQCADMVALTKLYNENKNFVDNNPWLRDVFNKRKLLLIKVTAKA